MERDITESPDLLSQGSLPGSPRKTGVNTSACSDHVVAFANSSDEEEKGASPKSEGGRSKTKKLLSPPLLCLSGAKLTWDNEGRDILLNCRTHLLSSAERRVLQRLVRQGCPRKYRKSLWMVASGAQASMESNPDYYKRLCACPVMYPNPSFRQIEVDLDRTFSDAEGAGKRDIGSLRNVLYAYVKRNPTVGYCQGLNFIVAHFLRYLNEEETFWAICNLIETLLPVDYYSAMIGVLIDQKIFTKIIKASMPMLWAHLRKLHLDPSLVTLQWFICLFSYNLNQEASDEIWDHLFLNGSKVLFRAGLALISLIEKNILKCKEFPEAFTLLEKEPRSFADISALAQTMNLKRFKYLTNSYIQMRRHDKRYQIYKQLNISAERKNRRARVCGKFRYFGKLALCATVAEGKEMAGDDNVGEFQIENSRLECSHKWPVCAFDHTYKSRCTSYFHAKVLHSSIEFIDEYFDEVAVRKKEAGETAKDNDSDSLLMERNVHYCGNPNFTGKINMLLRTNFPFNDAFPTELIDLPIDESTNYSQRMEAYILHILKYKIPEEQPQLPREPEASKLAENHREAYMEATAKEPAAADRKSLKTFRTLTAKDLENLLKSTQGQGQEEEDHPHRKSISGLGYEDQMEELRKSNPMNLFLEKLAQKTAFMARGDTVNNTPSAKFLQSIMLPEAQNAK